MKTFSEVIIDLNKLIGHELSSISGRATPFKILDIDIVDRKLYLDVNGARRTRTFDELESLWAEMRTKPAVHVDSFLGGSGSSRNQPETILANLPYVEWLYIEGKKHIAYVGEDTHDYGTLKEMDDERAGQYSAAMSEASPRNPILNDYDDDEETQRVTGGYNVLLYGVPGCGKSYTVKKEYCDDPMRMERVVFHPDYTYSDFVGQILPCANENKITYVFTPGPFTRLLRKAQDTPELEFYLIIEEINRGNAPAIFGEIFQLLDRTTTGASEYGISNADIAKVVYGNENRLVMLPSNFFIIATMNTSDQNVFALDTAFQRRWKMRMIENNIEKAEHASQKILDTDITWGKFAATINNLILDNNIGMTSSEDKRLGAYFVESPDLVFNPDEDNEDLDETARKRARTENRSFPEKVLKFLWDDAFKFSRESVFNPNYRSLEEIIRVFESSRKAERFSVFKDNPFAIVNTEE